MGVDELITKKDLEMAVTAMKNEIIRNMRNLLSGKCDEVMNVPEAARFLKCSEVTIRRRAQNGEIAYSKEGKDLKFLESDLRSYLQKRRVMTADEAKSFMQP